MCEDKIVNIISDLVGENMSVRKIGCHCLEVNVRQHSLNPKI